MIETMAYILKSFLFFVITVIYTINQFILPALKSGIDTKGDRPWLGYQPVDDPVGPRFGVQVKVFVPDPGEQVGPPKGELHGSDLEFFHNVAGQGIGQAEIPQPGMGGIVQGPGGVSGIAQAGVPPYKFRVQGFLARGRPTVVKVPLVGGPWGIATIPVND